MELSDRIRAVREEKRIKLIEMATALGVDVSNYAKIEKKGKKLTLERIEEIANALGVPIVELLGYQAGSLVQPESNLQRQILALEETNRTLSTQLDKEKEEKAVFRDTLQMVTNLFNGLFKGSKNVPQLEGVPDSFTDEELEELRNTRMSINLSQLKMDSEDAEKHE